MQVFQNLLQITAPLFLLVLIGYGLSAWARWPTAVSDALTRFVFAVAISYHAPAMSDSATMNPPREAFWDGAHALLPSLVGAAPFGLITGVAGTAAGLSPVETVGLSVVAFSGIAQRVVCQLLATLSPVPVVLLAAAVVSLRFLMYSAALAPHLGHLPLRWKIALAYLTTDQGFASSVSHFHQSGGVSDREWYHLGGGLAQWVPWQITVAIGAVLGAQVPANWSLDFAVPLTFLAMLIPAIKDRGTAIAASAAGAATLAAVGLPFRLGLIVAALVGIATGLFSARLQDKGGLGNDAGRE